MIIAIGNSPSSGSTFLADLLDSLPFAVCGPELHLLSPQGHYQDISELREGGFSRSATPSCYAAYADHLLWPALRDYDITPDEFTGLLPQASSFPDLCDRFFRLYAARRGRDAQLFFEKTPENVHSARSFLDTFEQGRVVHIVRDPSQVYRSLRRRGFGDYIAAATWLIDVAGASTVRGHSRVYELRYEDLVADPEKAVADLLAWLGSPPPPADFESRYRNNTYRARAPRKSSWTYAGYGQLSDAGTEDEQRTGQSDQALLARLSRMQISPAYAERFDLPECGYPELMELYGYGGGECVAQGDVLIRDWTSTRLLAKKWLKDAAFGLAGLGALPTYLRPVVSTGAD